MCVTGPRKQMFPVDSHDARPKRVAKGSSQALFHSGENASILFCNILTVYDKTLLHKVSQRTYKYNLSQLRL